MNGGYANEISGCGPASVLAHLPVGKRSTTSTIPERPHFENEMHWPKRLLTCQGGAIIPHADRCIA
jgi:hypothetical protein